LKETSHFPIPPKHFFFLIVKEKDHTSWLKGIILAIKRIFFKGGTLQSWASNILFRFSCGDYLLIPNNMALCSS